MKKYCIILVFALLCTFQSFAQTECNCRKNFDEIYQKVTDNYAAFNEKTSGRNKSKFNSLSKKVKAEAALITEIKPCFELINSWTEFFKDNHLFVNPANSIDRSESPAIIQKRAAEQESQKYNSENDFQAYLTQNAKTLDQEEGIWMSDDQVYKLGIVKSAKDKYVGFLLNGIDNLWTAGKNKFILEKTADNSYKATYFFADFGSEVNFAKIIKNYLVIENIYKFTKLSPTPKTYVNGDDLSHRLPDTRVEKLNATTTLVTLPPFTMPNSPQFTAEMIKQNAALIESSKYLIIDLRNNPGGDESVFDPLFPYISNTPIVRKGSKIRATQENYILLASEIKAVAEMEQFKNIIPKLQVIVDLMQANMGGMVTGPDKTIAPVQGIKAPEKIVILINQKTASTAESISLEAKQSSKVILMGTQSKGAFDYTETRDWSLPCYGWRLGVPIGLSARLPLQPLENVGIKPDVSIPTSELDWVKYATQYLNK
jgi:Peptidase family S41